MEKINLHVSPQIAASVENLCKLSMTTKSPAPFTPLRSGMLPMLPAKSFNIFEVPNRVTTPAQQVSQIDFEKKIVSLVPKLRLRNNQLSSTYAPKRKLILKSSVVSSGGSTTNQTPIASKIGNLSAYNNSFSATK
jgi:hypothetical protein